VSSEKTLDQEVVVDSPEWTAEFMDAAKQATSAAVEAHLSAGNPVYFTDADGNICELTPDRRVRNLTQTELDQLLGE
jgi:catechol-2,3-dioxygenase